MRKFRRLVPILSLALCTSLGMTYTVSAQDIDRERAYKNERISVRISNEPLSTIIERVAAQAKVKIYLQGVTLIGIDRPTTVNENDKTLDEILRELLKGQNVRLRYEIGRTIYVEPADEEDGEFAMMPVQGIVRGSDAPEGLIGATVVITDGSGNSTGMGCVTNADGKFSINVPRKQSIKVSFIGYKSKSVQILKPETALEITLNANTVDMDQVVVTGISKRSKSSFTGNYVTVKGDELRRVSPTNILRGLQFYDPSFRIVENNQTGSDPNAQMDFRIRGDQSLGINTEANSMDLMLDNVSSRPNVPLFVLNGFTVPISRILSLDPERVESITILKDAAATAIYGSNAANGVIVVETKVAPDGALSVSYSGNFTVQAPDLTDYNLCNAEEKLELEWMAGIYSPTNNTEMNLYNRYKRNVLAGVNTYWLSQPLRTAFIQNHSLTAAGGTDVFRYTLGVNAGFTPGVMKGSSNNNKSVNLNMSYTKNRIVVGADITLTETQGKNSPYGSFSSYTEANPYYQIRNAEGEYDKILDTKGLGAGYANQSIYNPLYNSQFNARNETNNLNITAQLNAEYMLLSNLRLTAQLSYMRGMARTEAFSPAGMTRFDQVQDLTQRGAYDKSTGELTSWSSNLGINYNLQLNKHLISLFGNWTVNEDTNNQVSMSATGYPDEHMDDFIFGFETSNRPTGTEETSRAMGLTGQFSYSYDNKYSFDFNVRADMSSRFGEDNRMEPFWSAGVRWNAYREKWLEGRLSNLVFRASYGVTGSQNYDPYQAIEFYTFSNSMKPYQSFNVLGALLQGLNNSSLGWSKTGNLSLAVDLGFWRNRVNMTFNYYNNITREMLVNFDLAPSTGFASQMLNAGELQNRGFDASLNVIAFQDLRRQLYWTIGVNANRNKNKIRKISNELQALNEKQLASEDAPLPMYQEGQSTTTLFTVPSLGIDPSSGQEVYLKRNGEKTFKWDPVDKVPVGDTNPKVSGAINSSLNWQDFSFSVNMTYRYGGITYNSTLVDKLENRNVAFNTDRRALTNRWLKPGDVARYKALDRQGSETPQSSRFIMDDNELNLASIAVGYRFRDDQFAFLRKCSIQALNLNFTTSDLVRWSTVKMERGLDYPFARSYTMSLSIIFK